MNSTHFERLAPGIEEERLFSGNELRTLPHLLLSSIWEKKIDVVYAIF